MGPWIRGKLSKGAINVITSRVQVLPVIGYFNCYFLLEYFKMSGCRDVDDLLL